ncbi:mycofactocin precursor [Streptomyces sp. V3I8]|jgi:mycofactocin precursor|nr:mycofactocin precursor MftA [Streptomyces sp. V3I8]MDQ1041716.1 mycofactocin precursor [Streptomyces sp. V3I8]
MSETAHSPEPAAGSGTEQVPADRAGQELLVEDDLLVEEVSIDGMCGVY